MENNIEKLINGIKQQAEIFLLDAGEFFPFGSSIDINDNFIPIGAYLNDENDRPESLPLIAILEKGIREEIENGSYVIAAIAVDGLIKEGEQPFDVIQIRVFEADRTYIILFKYIVEGENVKFIPASA
jgi:hypothetical protein